MTLFYCQRITRITRIISFIRFIRWLSFINIQSYEFYWFNYLCNLCNLLTFIIQFHVHFYLRVLRVLRWHPSPCPMFHAPFLYLYRWKVRGAGLDGEISKQPVRTQWRRFTVVFGRFRSFSVVFSAECFTDSRCPSTPTFSSNFIIKYLNH